MVSCLTASFTIIASLDSVASPQTPSVPAEKDDGIFDLKPTCTGVRTVDTRFSQSRLMSNMCAFF